MSPSSLDMNYLSNRDLRVIMKCKDFEISTIYILEKNKKEFNSIYRKKNAYCNSLMVFSRSKVVSPTTKTTEFN